MLIGCGLGFQFEVREAARIFSYPYVTLCTLPAAIIFDDFRHARHNPIVASDGFAEVSRSSRRLFQNWEDDADDSKRAIFERFFY
jgi:hypothetical protein